MRNETHTMQYEAIPAKDQAGDWIVEAINHDNDGEVYMVRFTGPNAEDRATEYAEWKNSGTGWQP